MFLNRKCFSLLIFNQNIRHIVRNSRHKSDYQLVYSFSYVRVGSIVNKMKFQQTLLTGVALPISAVLEYLSFVSPGVTYACLAVGATMNASVYGIGQLFCRSIGKVYLNEKDDVAKFAYVGFTGQRLEIEVPRQDIILPDIDKPPGFLFTKIEFADDDLVLKLSEKYYDFCDKDLARKVFGESFQRTQR